MLSTQELVENREKAVIELPTFGVKEFEPDGSEEQSYQINQSVFQIKNVISHERVKLVNTLSQAVWQEEMQLAEVTHQTGSYWDYMGHKIGEKLYIYPEEALYLLETGCLQFLYNEVPLSIQRAYFVVIGAGSNTTIEKYRVYSHLSSYGYKVLRHSPLNTVTMYEKKLEVHKIGLKLKTYSTLGKVDKRQQVSDQSSSNKKLKLDEDPKPVLSTHEKEDDNKESLKQIPKIQSYTETSETSLNFDFDVYSETSDGHSFKKSCLQLPNFRVIVHRSEDSTPDVKELCKLSNKYKDEVPVIHAIVFPDCIAFYKIDPVILPDAED